jgi:hypothetical protein
MYPTSVDPGAHAGLETDYLEIARGFPQFFKSYAGILLKLDRDRFTSHIISYSLYRVPQKPFDIAFLLLNIEFK